VDFGIGGEKRLIEMNIIPWLHIVLMVTGSIYPLYAIECFELPQLTDF